MKAKNLFEKEFKEILDSFPKLSLYNTNETFWSINGELDICDNEENYCGTFKILIVVPRSYPNCVPEVYEISHLIDRNENRHINQLGKCCLDIKHKLKYKAQKGIKLIDFMLNDVYPYFANQIYYIKHGEYAGEEYQHGDLGVFQFYRENLNINSRELAIKVLKLILTNSKIPRNGNCICGQQKKYKKCHLESIEYLNVLGVDFLRDDLKSFVELGNL